MDKPCVPGGRLKLPAVPDPDLQYKGLHKKDKQKKTKHVEKQKDVKKDPRGEDWYENPCDFDGKVSKFRQFRKSYMLSLILIQMQSVGNVTSPLRD